MRIRRRIAIPVIAFGILAGSAGIANATVTPTPTGNDNSVSYVSTGFPTPTPTPFPRRFCRVEFNRLFIPTVNPFTGLPIRAGQWDRICFSRFGGVTITPLTPPIVF